MNWNPVLILLSFGLIGTGIVLIILQRQKFLQTTAVLKDCICYNQANLCVCNGTYTYKDSTIQSGIPSLPGTSKDGDQVQIWVDTSNPYVTSANRPGLETIGYLLIFLGSLELVILIGRGFLQK